MMGDPENIQVRKRLDELIRSSDHDNYATVSALIGKNHAYIQQFVKRGIPKRLHERDRNKLASHFGVSESELGAPQSLSMDEGAPDTLRIPLTAPLSDQHYLLINAYDLLQFAEDGYTHDQPAADQIAFHRSWLDKGNRQLEPEKLAVFTIRGDAMAPTLGDGDHILVDMSRPRPSGDGIYVFRLLGAVHIKRISINPVTQRITVRSDNPLYESWPGCAPDQIDFLGRVIWVGHQI